MTKIIDALRAETARTGDFLASLNADDWARDTRCPPMRLHELVSHTLRGGVRIKEMLAAGAVESEPEADGATYFRYDPAVVGPDVVERAFAAAMDFPPAELPRRWRSEWTQALDAAKLEVDGGDRVFKNVFGGLMKLSEYLRTRAVEVVVHHMDMRDAMGLGPDPDPEALDAVCGVLAELLGTDPRSLGMDGIRFALVGTGREPVSDDLKSTLGPLAELLPVIS